MVEGTNAWDVSCGATTMGGAFFKECNARVWMGLEQDTGAAQAGDARADYGNVKGRRGGVTSSGGDGGGGGGR